VNDSENFGSTITEIGVAVATIWQKEIIGTHFEFLKVARAISGIIFENQGAFLKIRGPRLGFIEGQGANCKISGDFLARIYFSKGKQGGLSPPFMDH
jgi:hypothetical protein